MTRVFCDECGSEISGVHARGVEVHADGAVQHYKTDLCARCLDDLVTPPGGRVMLDLYWLPSAGPVPAEEIRG